MSNKEIMTYDNTRGKDEGKKRVKSMWHKMYGLEKKYE